MLQHDRQLKLIAKNIKNKIKKQLESLLKDERDKYAEFYQSFGRQLKYGVYSDFGSNKEDLQDLLMFYSSKEKKMVTLDDYVSRMPEDQKFIYYASGETNDRIEKLPQIELISEKGYEILYFTDDIDEFAIKMLMTYKHKEFKSVSSGDLGIETAENENNTDSADNDNKELFDYMRNILSGKIKDVRASKRLKTHPVCLSNEGEVSIEMEKILKLMPNSPGIKADKILEINMNHGVYKSLQDAFEKDKDKLNLFTNLLYHQALLIEGLPIDDPVEFTNDICKIMIELNTATY
jgi:molecular chaperone HtpG